MSNPHCPLFRASALASWICAWWETEATETGIEKFCSRPVWEERVCETQGLRFMPRADDEDDGWQDAVDLGEPR